MVKRVFREYGAQHLPHSLIGHELLVKNGNNTSALCFTAIAIRRISTNLVYPLGHYSEFLTFYLLRLFQSYHIG
jgi:hypothetical protein